MNVKLRKMTVSEFELFKQYSIEDYAIDIIKNSDKSLKEAQSQAEKEFSDMLKDGVDTKDNDLMIIEDCDAEKNVGVIWYLYECTDGVKYTFLSDFVVKEEERRKGYATAALYEMEKEAGKHDCTECRLYVGKDNKKGINLYTKVGYEIFRNVDGGMYMAKTIHL
ncbi:GNAT family N-acetyltransferase [Eisenbergiella sp.]